jgi:hypothetical protein
VAPSREVQIGRRFAQKDKSQDERCKEQTDTARTAESRVTDIPNVPNPLARTITNFCRQRTSSAVCFVPPRR